MTAKTDKAVPGSLVIAETSTSSWNYHLRRVASDGKLYPGGGAPPALCGVALGWDTTQPIEAWGTESHVPQHWCADCHGVAKEEVLRATMLPMLDIVQKGLTHEGYMPTRTTFEGLSIHDRPVYQTVKGAAEAAEDDLSHFDKIKLGPGDRFLVCRVRRTNSFAGGTYMEIRTLEEPVLHVVGRDGKATKSRGKKTR